MTPQAEFREGLDELAVHYKEVLKLLGEDPTREGLEKTPIRVAKAMQVLTRGYTQDPKKVLTDALFEEKYNQMVIVKDIDFFSMCEHHMLPFYGKAHVAYIPNGHITGLSKIARVVDIFSHRLQVQERLTEQIMQCINDTLKPQGVMVVIEAKHMCMQMRGVEKQNSITTTSAYSGVFESSKTRNEFMNLLRAVSVFLSLKSRSYFVSFLALEESFDLLSSALTTVPCNTRRNAKAPPSNGFQCEIFIIINVYLFLYSAFTILLVICCFDQRRLFVCAS
mgnify:CR=1 FL=1